MQSSFNKNYLQKTKIKISLIFTILSIFILSLMNFLHFSFKYQRNILAEKEILEKTVKESFSPEFKMMRLMHKRPIFNSANFFLLDTGNLRILNEKNSSNIEFSQISEKISNLWKNFSLEKFFINWEEFLVSKKNSRDWNLVSISFKKNNYSKSDLFSDFFTSLSFIFFFWFVLYFLVYFLISRNFKVVEKNFEEMENFVHNAWHELKTPLAVISSNLQIAEKIWKIGDFKELNKENLIEINKANSLINWLFSLAKISKWENLKKINLKKEIEKILSESEKKFSEKNISLKTDLENFDFKISKEHFYILFSNIFFNAIRYSEKNSEIFISLKKWILEISDKWIWISGKNLEKIFDRFFQEWKSRESSDWFWIWLSLVKKICDVYSLKISVKSKIWNWTSFRIKF